MLTHQALLQLLKQQPELFSTQDRQSLLNLIPTLPDDTQEISNQLANWSKDHAEIRTALLSLVSIGEMAFGRNIVPDDPKEYKTELTNALVRSEKPEAAADPKKPESPAEPKK